MRCDEARLRVSLAADDALDRVRTEELERHVAACEQCRLFAERVIRIHHYLRAEPAGDAPNVAPAVMDAIRQPSSEQAAPGGLRRLGRPALLQVAAAFLAGLLIGALVVRGEGGNPHVAAAAELPGRILDAQADVETLEAEITLIERGWHPEVPVRRFSGVLEYRAPESLRLSLHDETEYPDSAWVENDVELVVSEDAWRTRGPRACPTEALPDCTPREPRVRVVDGREPFASAAPVPLDLVVPVRSFVLSAPPPTVESRTVDGRSAVGVAVSAAQVDPLLEGLRPAGNLRQVHPSDRVRLWLDEETLVPLALHVLPANDPARARWANARGYTSDEPDTPVLKMELSSVTVNGGTVVALPPAPEDAVRADAGFRDGETTAPPGMFAVPRGFAPQRSGFVTTPGGPRVEVHAWTDGRAWLKLRATREWEADHLFGDLGPLVREVEVGDGVAYFSEDGSRLALHAEAVDVVVTGSVAESVLLEFARGLDLTGLPVPHGWAEAGTSSLTAAREALPGLLVPSDLAGFADPAVRVEESTVTLAFAGPGARGFVLVQAPGEFLTPPLDAEVQAVAVRGERGRYSQDRGELEWGEDGTVVSLRSVTLTLRDLVEIAESLEPT